METVLEVDGNEIQAVEPSEPEAPRLTFKELADLQLYQFQTRAYAAEMELEIMRKDAYLKQIDPAGKLSGMFNVIRAKSNNLSEARVALEKTRKEIETRLGLELENYAFDDLTGILSKVDK